MWDELTLFIPLLILIIYKRKQKLFLKLFLNWSIKFLVIFSLLAVIFSIFNLSGSFEHIIKDGNVLKKMVWKIIILVLSIVLFIITICINVLFYKKFNPFLLLSTITVFMMFLVISFAIDIPLNAFIFKISIQELLIIKISTFFIEVTINIIFILIFSKLLLIFKKYEYFFNKKIKIY